MNTLPETLPQFSWMEPLVQQYILQTPSIPFIDELFLSRSLVGRDGNTIPLNVYIPALEGEVLYSLIRYLRPNVSLEIDWPTVSRRSTSRKRCTTTMREDIWRSIHIRALTGTKLD